LDEEFFIGLNNILETVLTGVGNLTDSFGGMSGVLSVVSATLVNLFNK
jgi:hypothetical protein